MTNIFKNTFQVLTKKEKSRFGILLLLDILISVLDILSLAFLLWIVQFYIQPGTKAATFLPTSLADKNSITLIAVFFVLFSLKNLSAFLVSKKQFEFIGKVAVRVSGNSLKKYQHSSFTEFITVDSSVQIRKIGFQPFEFCQYILSGIQQIVTQSSLVLLAIAAIFVFNAKLFLFLLIILLPPVVVTFYFIKRKLAGIKAHIRSSNERSFQYLLDALKGYVEGNIYDRNDFFLKRFVNYREKFSTYLFRSLNFQNLPGRIIEIFAVLGLFLLITIAKWTGNNDGDTLITIGAFIAAAYKIIPGVVKIINVNGQMKAFEFAVPELSAVSKNEIDEEKTPLNSVELKNISFNYKELPVLKDFNLFVETGDFVGLAGRSGKGKTTVLNIVLGFVKQDQGEILINGNSTAATAIKNYWPSISYVRQQSFFIHDSIERNITLMEGVPDPELFYSVLKITGLDELIKNYPEGVNKVITENGKNISGGQQQRISLARALYKNADLILLDEPFNELDETSELKLLEYFKGLSSKGKIILLITHNQKALSYCNKIVSLDE